MRNGLGTIYSKLEGKMVFAFAFVSTHSGFVNKPQASDCLIMLCLAQPLYFAIWVPNLGEIFRCVFPFYASDQG